MVLICNYYVSMRCNSKCEFCNIWNSKDNSLAKYSDFENNIKDLKALGVKLIDFTGGEPLMNPEIDLFLKLAKVYKIRTALTTNAILFPKKWRKIHNLVDILSFSLDGYNEDTHNKIRGVNCFNSLMESISIAQKERFNFYIIHTITNKNYKNLGRVLSLAKQKKFLVKINPEFSYFRNSGFNRAYIREILKYKHHPNILINYAQLKFLKKNYVNPPCKIAKTNIVISSSNELILPCFHHQIKKLKINSNLKKIYKSPEVRKLLKNAGKFNFCRGCSLWCYFVPSFLYNINFFKDNIKCGIDYLLKKRRLN
ncbi:MAG: radical SAM protein [Nanoarchaeota archaeon]|nr:radical SAM protein [Nanoarchaeota archaeon]